VVNNQWWLISLAVFATSVSASQEQDPTAPLGWMKSQKVQKVQAVPVPQLQSIVCKGNDKCYAILNDQVVEAGEKVSGYRVVEVTDNHVELKQGQKSWTLKLFALDIKQ